MKKQKEGTYDLGNDNFFADNQLFLVRCPECGRENYLMQVGLGTCAWCDLDGYEYYKEYIKSIKEN